MSGRIQTAGSSRDDSTCPITVLCCIVYDSTGTAAVLNDTRSHLHVGLSID